jgi:hypothetical protein
METWLVSVKPTWHFVFVLIFSHGGIYILFHARLDLDTPTVVLSFHSSDFLLQSTVLSSWYFSKMTCEHRTDTFFTFVLGFSFSGNSRSLLVLTSAALSDVCIIQFCSNLELVVLLHLCFYIWFKMQDPFKGCMMALALAFGFIQLNRVQKFMAVFLLVELWNCEDVTVKF